MKTAFAVALLLAPVAAVAQTAPAQPVTVEIVAAGEVVVPAQHFRFSVKVTGKGADNDAAGKALAANRAKIVAALARLNVREAKPVQNGPLSIASIFAGIGNPNSPSFSPDYEGMTELMTESADAVEGDEKADEAKVETPEPSVIGTESVMFDAPNRAAITQAAAVLEANGGSLEETVLPVLDDYVAPTRQAKADALKKARAEADAYAAGLGLRTVTVVKISERQDIVAGSLGFVSQLFGMFMSTKGKGAQSDTVPVQANLTVEFQLSR